MSRLSDWRHSAWRWLTATDERTWWAHGFLAVAVSAVPAGLIGGLVGSTLVFVILGHVFSGVFSRFMTGREVADYLRHERAGDAFLPTIKDGLGDLMGVYAVDLFWLGWIVILLAVR